MKPIVKNYFYGTKNELRGIAALFLFVFLILIFQLFGIDKVTNSTVDENDFHAKASIITVLTTSNYNQKSVKKETQNIAIELFDFNPNITSKANFERLGLSAKTAQSIINYRNKGGKFFKPEDFKKIYTLSDADYNRLSSYINIPTRNNYENTKEEIVESKVVELFQFNPNKANKADFERLGLSARTAQSIINYRNKGGKFFKPQDFKKIYTLSDADYNRLESYIELPKVEKAIAKKEKDDESHIMGFAQTAKPKTEYVKKSLTVKIDVNTASIEDFQQLKGIGKGYAQRIVKYRKKLGGFVRTEQLKEVYGFPKEIYETIENQLVLKSKSTTKININTTTYEDLVQHPYIDSKRANAIIKYRKQHGKFKSINDLTKIYAISKSTLNTIKPYLKV